ncbi:hypothetical protein LOK49_LG06G02232 [Camellia lanceoleosa]|uniref:Uncharacterized protein n=1 Tax=Camellia lanceoleosa TaxID=1840588 RepID=A0ACC0HG68_9ERIC|nr:hypothetical protein LOK49_LG06G02232 [Camellia lanceoleosa]
MTANPAGYSSLAQQIPSSRLQPPPETATGASCTAAAASFLGSSSAATGSASGNGAAGASSTTAGAGAALPLEMELLQQPRYYSENPNYQLKLLPRFTHPNNSLS